MAFTERPEASQLSARSERVKKVAALSGRSFRAKEGLFRIEGPQGVRSVLEQRPDLIEALYLTERAAQQHPELDDLAQLRNIDVVWVSGDVIEAMVREQGHQSVANPQGAIAVARECDQPWRSVLASLPSDGPVTIVVCERLQDPGNAGVIMRTADAAGAHAVFFGEDSTDIFAPKVVRSSVGSLLHVPVSRKVPIAELLESLAELGIHRAGTSPYGEHDIYAAQPAPRIAWLMGNEARGLDQATLDACDSRVRIPIFGRAESLNLATAATLCLYESARHYGSAQ